MRSRLVTRSTFGSSPSTDVLAAAIRAAFDSTERCVVLAAVAADAVLWRDGACDLALLFLGATLLRLPGGFDGKCRHGFGPLGPRRQNWRSHDPKPRTSRSEPLGGADSASPRRHQCVLCGGNPVS